MPSALMLSLLSKCVHTCCKLACCDAATTFERAKNFSLQCDYSASQERVIFSQCGAEFEAWASMIETYFQSGTVIEETLQCKVFRSLALATASSTARHYSVGNF